MLDQCIGYLSRNNKFTVLYRLYNFDHMQSAREVPNHFWEGALYF